MVPHSRHGRKIWKWPQRGLQMWHSHFRPAEMSDTHSTPHRHPKTHLCIQHGSHRFSPEKKLYLHNYDQTKPPHNRGNGNTQHLKKSKKHWQFGHPPIGGWIQKPSSQWFYVASLLYKWGKEHFLIIKGSHVQDIKKRQRKRATEILGGAVQLLQGMKPPDWWVFRAKGKTKHRGMWLLSQEG